MSDDTHWYVAMKQRAEEARKKREKWEGKEVLACDECGTKVPVDDIESAVDKAERHDEKRHDGEPTATVNGMRLPDIDEETKEQIQEVVEQISEMDD